jgi:hypothetical protein
MLSSLVPFSEQSFPLYPVSEPNSPKDHGTPEAQNHPPDIDLQATETKALWHYKKRKDRQKAKESPCPVISPYSKEGSQREEMDSNNEHHHGEE